MDNGKGNRVMDNGKGELGNGYGILGNGMRDGKGVTGDGAKSKNQNPQSRKFNISHLEDCSYVKTASSENEKKQLALFRKSLESRYGVSKHNLTHTPQAPKKANKEKTPTPLCFLSPKNPI